MSAATPKAATTRISQGQYVIIDGEGSCAIIADRFVAVQQLTAACQGGNLNACVQLEQLQTQQQAIALQAWQA